MAPIKPDVSWLLRALNLMPTETSRIYHRDIENTLCVSVSRSRKPVTGPDIKGMTCVTSEHVKNTTLWSHRQAQQLCVPCGSSRQAYRSFSVDAWLFATDECQPISSPTVRSLRNTDIKCVCVDRKKDLSLHFGI
jgi:hypothetical protein